MLDHRERAKPFIQSEAESERSVWDLFMTTEISVFHRTTQSCNQPLRKLRRLWLEHIARIPPLCASEQHSSPSQEGFHLFIYLFIYNLFVFTRAGSRDKRRRARVAQTLQKKFRRVRKCLFVFFFSFSFFLFVFKRVASGLFIGAEWRHCGLWSDQDWISQHERIFSSAETWREAAVWCGEELETGGKGGGVVWRSALVCITAAPRLMYFLQSSNSFCVLFCSNMIRSCDDLRELPVKCMICYCCWFVALMFAKVKSNQSS